MIKHLSLVLMLCICTTFVSCNNKNNVSEKSTSSLEQVETSDENLLVEDFSKFSFLDNTYEKNEDIRLLEEGTEIFNAKNGQDYIRGKYFEGDFAIDLVTKYLEGNMDIYNYLYSEVEINNNVILMSNEEKQRLIESQQFLKEQMEIQEGQPIYFKLDKLIYNGQVNENNNELEFEVRGFISAYSDYFASISSFPVTVCIDKDRVYGNIN